MATRLLPLALLLLLWAAAPTIAAAVETPVGDVPVLALEDEEPEAEAAAEDVEEECEETEEGFEECEEAEAASEGDERAREDCVLRSARGHASVDRHGRKLKLTIGYTAYEPVKAKVEISKGGNRLATVKRRLGRSGVLRVTKKLDAKNDGKQIVVSIEIPSARNAGCPSWRLALSLR